MDKYVILLILNIPFVLFGLMRAIIMYKTGLVRFWGFVMRLVFWLLVATGLIFAKEIYSYLLTKKITDSQPLSLADVVLVTGVSLSLFLNIQLFTKVDLLEKRLVDLNERLSINNSKIPRR